MKRLKRWLFLPAIFVFGLSVLVECLRSGSIVLQFFAGVLIAAALVPAVAAGVTVWKLWPVIQKAAENAGKPSRVESPAKLEDAPLPERIH